MRTVQVYIEGQLLDLFKDEQISVTSIQQNVQDISKVFSDFSQSFTVPATPNNNSIFEYFYENDIQSTIDHNVRREALIEIDLTTFRRGKISLEKAEIKNNRAQSYTITFYGEVTSLKDKFNDEKLVDLSYLQSYGHAYNGTEIQNRITDGSTNYTLRYPLITQRVVTYGDGGSNDISATGSSSIAFGELFPAIKVSGIFAAIKIRYGVDFQGAFLSDKRFQNCFLYCKNKNDFSFLTTTQDINLSTGGELVNQSTFSFNNYFDTTNNTLSYQYYDWFTIFPNVSPGPVNVQHIVNIEVTSAIPVAQYYIDVYINNVLSQTLDGTSTNTFIVANDQNVQGLNKTFYFRARSTATQDLNFRVTYQQLGTAFSSGNQNQVQNIFYSDSATLSLTATIDPIAYLPDMKVADFFTGVLKEFNLTCYGISKDVYQVEPLDDWYLKGAIVDITQYADIESIKVDRIKLFKNIVFKYAESKNVLNEAFKELNLREFGNAQIQYDYDGGEYKIEQPFENMMFNLFTGTSLQVGYTVDKDLNKYIPKPMLLYMNEQTAATFRFNDGGGAANLSQYMPFGQDMTLNAENFNLNFNAEISTFTLQTEPNTLFAVYYFGYLSNLFNLKNRKTTVKTNLPISLLTSLRLNDRVIIRDKRYIIESMKSNLSSGQVDFVLINDFRPVLADDGSTPERPIVIDSSAQCIQVPILLPSNCGQANVTTSNAGVTINPTSFTADGFTEVCVPANTNTIHIKSEDNADNLATEDLANQLITEQNDVAIYTIVVTYTYPDGSQNATSIIITQNA
jgi:hypothetical protein